MKSYGMLSIEKKYCLNTEPLFLNILKSCVVCNKIPLPCYKSMENQDMTYCKVCYDLQNFNPKNLIKPSIEIESILPKLVINCRNEHKGCKQRFTVDSLQNFLHHEQQCAYNMSPLLKESTIYIEEKVNKCVKCNDIIYTNIGNHDCTASLLELIFKMENKINSITSMYQQLKTEKHLSYIQLQSQISKLSHKLHSQNTQIMNHLKSNNNQIQHQIQFNFTQKQNINNLITDKQINQINPNNSNSERNQIHDQIQSQQLQSRNFNNNNIMNYNEKQLWQNLHSKKHFTLKEHSKWVKC